MSAWRLFTCAPQRDHRRPHRPQNPQEITEATTEPQTPQKPQRGPRSARESLSCRRCGTGGRRVPGNDFASCSQERVQSRPLVWGSRSATKVRRHGGTDLEEACRRHAVDQFHAGPRPRAPDPDAETPGSPSAPRPPTAAPLPSPTYTLPSAQPLRSLLLCGARGEKIDMGFGPHIRLPS
jgi:hypothetical protein